MPEIHPSLLALFDHAAGRSDASLRAHLASCERCAAPAAGARRVVEIGRRALAGPRPARRHMRAAIRAFRQARENWGNSLLKLVLDSMLRPAPAPALRAGASPPRFLRYEGEVTVELQITSAARGVSLLGCVSPPDRADEVILTAGSTQRRTLVDKTGMFALRRVPRRELELRIGSALITGLRP